MKKISVLLMFVLVLALAVPAFAAEDNVKITGEVKTIFETAGYGDNEDATISLWEDGDVIDEDSETDPDEFPAEKAFYQEIDFAVAGMINENITFDLAIDTLVNNFTTVEGPNNAAGDILGDQGDGKGGDSSDLVLDSALLTISDGVSTLKFGDMGDFHADNYFIDEEDVEGMEFTTAIGDRDIRAFVASENDDFDGIDLYGATVSQQFNKVGLTGKLYQARRGGESLTNLAVAADLAVNDAVTIDGEVVSNDESQGDQGDILARANVEAALTDALTVKGGFETVGEDFAVLYNTDGDNVDDLEEVKDYDLFTVGADYALNDANTVGVTYTMVSVGDTFGTDTEDKNTIELSLDNVTGAFTNTAAIEFTANDDYDRAQEDDDTTVITLGTEYAMSDLTTVTGKLVNKSSDDGYDVNYTYLVAGLDHQISETISWDTEARFITGEDTADVDGEGSSLKTQLNVKF
ncbi:hypothetical protein [Orenia marismortui]|uniref:hypothetical protein n=1 Tax=Orenia marismortui TaxID=46469 RepID=UPI000366D699|nr:hypothetical protein [Orenia marismortui]